MFKGLDAGTGITYGPTLPSTTLGSEGGYPSSPIMDGQLFYKTNSVGQPAGLYMFGYTQDANSSLLGDQSTQGWVLLTATGNFVLNSGGVMTGSLEIPDLLRITKTTGAQRILIGNQDSGGVNKPIILESNNGILNIGVGSSWLTNGGTLQAPALTINPTANTLTFGSGTVWTSNNDGSGSGLDADLLRGFSPSQSNTASTIAQRTSSGNIVASAFEQSSTNNENPTVSQILVTNGTDNVLRKSSVLNLSNAIRTVANGSWGISITGNASTATLASNAMAAVTATNSPSDPTGTGVISISHGGTGQTTKENALLALLPDTTGATNKVITFDGTNVIWQAANTGSFVEVTGSTMTGVLNISNNTNSTSTSTGALKITGGVGVGGNIWVGGTLYSAGDVISSASDKRLKLNIAPISNNPIEDLKKLSGYRYDWNKEKCKLVGFKPIADTDVGVIAQELEEIIPEAVVQSAFSEGYKTVRYEKIIPLLIEVCKSQQTQIESLEEKINKLVKD